jgi:hypothetical protein
MRGVASPTSAIGKKKRMKSKKAFMFGASDARQDRDPVGVLASVSGRVDCHCRQGAEDAAVRNRLFKMAHGERHQIGEAQRSVASSGSYAHPASALTKSRWPFAKSLACASRLAISLCSPGTLAAAHCFDSCQGCVGPASVECWRANESFLFHVEGDGLGFDLPSVQRRSSGLSLVQGLVRQLSGKL